MGLQFLTLSEVSRVPTKKHGENEESRVPWVLLGSTCFDSGRPYSEESHFSRGIISYRLRIQFQSISQEFGVVAQDQLTPGLIFLQGTGPFWQPGLQTREVVKGALGQNGKAKVGLEPD